MPDTNDTYTQYIYKNGEYRKVATSEGGGGGGSSDVTVEIVNTIPATGVEDRIYLVKDTGGESIDSLSIIGNLSVGASGGTSKIYLNGVEVVNGVGKEVTSNKVTTITSSSTDTQYPSAKAVYDLIVSAINGSY